MNIYTPYTHPCISTVKARLVGVGSVVLFLNRSRVYLSRCQGVHVKGTPFSLTQVALIAALVTATAPVLVLIWLLQSGCSYRLFVQLTPTRTNAGPA